MRGQVLAETAHALAAADLAEDLDAGHAVVGVLERDDGVGPGRDRGAGHDAHGQSGTHARARVRTGGDVAHDGQRRRVVRAGVPGVDGAHGVAVHGRVVETGQGHGGQDVLGQQQTLRVEQGQLDRVDRADAVEHGLQVLVDRAQLGSSATRVSPLPRRRLGAAAPSSPTLRGGAEQVARTMPLWMPAVAAEKDDLRRLYLEQRRTLTAGPSSTAARARGTRRRCSSASPGPGGGRWPPTCRCAPSRVRSSCWRGSVDAGVNVIVPHVLADRDLDWHRWHRELDRGRPAAGRGRDRRGRRRCSCPRWPWPTTVPGSDAAAAPTTGRWAGSLPACRWWPCSTTASGCTTCPRMRGTAR